MASCRRGQRRGPRVRTGRGPGEGHLGLAGMRERTELLGGRFELDIQHRGPARGSGPTCHLRVWRATNRERPDPHPRSSTTTRCSSTGSSRHSRRTMSWRSSRPVCDAPSAVRAPASINRTWPSSMSPCPAAASRPLDSSARPRPRRASSCSRAPRTRTTCWPRWTPVPGDTCSRASRGASSGSILKSVHRGEVYVAPGLAYAMIKGLTRPRVARSARGADDSRARGARARRRRPLERRDRRTPRAGREDREALHDGDPRQARRRAVASRRRCLPTRLGCDRMGAGRR